MLKVNTRNLGNVTVLCLQGQIVNGETATLRNAVNAQFNPVHSHFDSAHSQPRVSTVVLDLARVTAVDARGLGLLLDLRRQTESRGIAFKLMNAGESVRRVLEVTRLDSVFEVIPRVEASPAISRTRSASMMKLAPCA
jgi:anti-anti-sigma factor